MKKFLMAVVAVLVLASCAGNVFEQGADVLNKATEEVAAVQTQAELDAIVDRVAGEIKAIEESEEMKEYQALVETNDTAALKEYEESQKVFAAAATRYAVAVDAAKEKVAGK